MRITWFAPRLVLWLAFLVVSPAWVFARDAVSEAASAARAIVQTEVVSKTPGLAIAVAVDEKVIWSEAFGDADLERKIPATTLTRFRIGSISKSLTAAGLALLVERGQLDLDAPLQKYIPDFPSKEAPITLRMLAGHLSGIRNYHGMEAASDKPYPSLRAGLKIFEDDPLLFAPGAKFSYSSYNWNVLGVAMEAASHEDFLDFMKVNVLDPLYLTNTVPDRANAADAYRAQFYETKATGEFIIAPPVDSSYKWPSGGFLSTAEDLARFGDAMLGNDFLKPSSRKLLFTSQKTSDGKLTHYGIGWFIGRTLVYHGGDAIGGTAVLLMVPEARVVVAICTNRGHIIVGRAHDASSATPPANLQLIPIAHRIADLFTPLHKQQ